MTPDGLDYRRDRSPPSTCVGLFSSKVRLGSMRERRTKRLDISHELAIRALQIALGGLTLGIPLALISTTVYRTFLFGVTRTDPSVVSAAAAAVVVMAVAAGYIPARRAVRIEPLTALREE